MTRIHSKRSSRRTQPVEVTPSRRGTPDVSGKGVFVSLLLLTPLARAAAALGPGFDLPAGPDLLRPELAPQLRLRAVPQGGAVDKIAVWDTRDALGHINATYYRWQDAAGAPRVIRYLSNRIADAFAGTDANIQATFGGRADAGIYMDAAGNTQTLVATENIGLGAVVNHFTDAQGNFDNTNTAYQRGLTGGTELKLDHLARHAFTWRFPINGVMMDTRTSMTIRTGRSEILFSVSQRPVDGHSDPQADVRAPYNKFSELSVVDQPVQNVSWADRYIFRSGAGNFTPQTSWTYDETNPEPAMPYVARTTAGYTMALAGTQTQSQNPIGGTSFSESWGATGDRMPQDSDFPNQLGQYGWSGGELSNKAITIQEPVGALGAASYDGYGDVAVANPDHTTSRSVLVVNDDDRRNPLGLANDYLRATQTTAFYATSQGATLLENGPAGLGRNLTQPLISGYDFVADVHRVQLDAAAPERLILSAQPGPTSLRGPTLAIAVGGATRQLGRVTVDGAALQKGRRGGFFASYDAAEATHYLTLDRTFAAQAAEPSIITVQLTPQDPAAAPAQPPSHRNAASPTLSARRGVMLGLASGLGTLAFAAAFI